MENVMRNRALLCCTLMLVITGCGPSAEKKAAAISAFTKIQQVLQHPRCVNCHIPGDAPLQFDSGVTHAQGIVRGIAGMGAPGLPCSACHGERNPPTSYGAHAPPGAPHWKLPPPNQKMAWQGLAASALCAVLKDPKQNGGRDLAALLKHISEDALVLWGWNPGGERAPVSVPHTEFVASFKTWMDAEAPCPSS
jgi:hypothetical protein